MAREASGINGSKIYANHAYKDSNNQVITATYEKKLDFGYEKDKIITINGSALNAGEKYTAGPNINITNNVVSGKNWSTEIKSATSGKADKSDIPSLDGYATEQWVKDQKYLTAHQDISNLATKEELNKKLDTSSFNDTIKNYYTKNETSSISELNTKFNTKQDNLTSEQLSSISSVSSISGDLKTNYYTTTQIDDKLNNSGSYLSSNALDNVSGIWNTVINKFDTSSMTAYYTSAQVEERLADFGGFEVVEGTGEDHHPNVETPSTKIIYLVKADSSKIDNYKEWIYTKNNSWELIGDTTIDLTNYYKKTDTSSKLELENEFNTKQDKLSTEQLSAISTVSSISSDLITNYYTTSQIDDKLNQSGTYLTADALDSLSGKWETVSEKLDTTALTDILTDYYKKTETSSINEIDSALSNKQDKLTTEQLSSISSVSSISSDLKTNYYTKENVNDILSQSGEYLSANALNDVSGTWNTVINKFDTSSMTAYYTSAQVEERLANFGGFEVVEGDETGKPIVDNPSTKIIYLVKIDTEHPDKYKEWIYTTDKEWELIGDTTIDLTGYYKKTETSGKQELENEFNTKQDILEFGYQQDKEGNEKIVSINSSAISAGKIYLGGENIEITDEDVINVSGKKFIKLHTDTLFVNSDVSSIDIGVIDAPKDDKEYIRKNGAWDLISKPKIGNGLNLENNVLTVTGKQDSLTKEQLQNIQDVKDIKEDLKLSYLTKAKAKEKYQQKYSIGTDLIFTNNILQVNTNGTAKEQYSFVEGFGTFASGFASHAEGYYTTAQGYASHAGGYYTVAKGNGSFAHGWTNGSNGNIEANGNGAIAVGASYNKTNEQVIASGNGTIAIGIGVSAYGLTFGGAVAMGRENLASGDASFTMGTHNSALGYGAVAEGHYDLASGNGAHVEGIFSYAIGSATHAEGGYTSALGNYSHVGGYYTIANYDYETVLGKYNLSSRTDNPLFVIGNGTSTANRSDAFLVRQDGIVSAKFIDTTILRLKETYVTDEIIELAKLIKNKPTVGKYTIGVENGTLKWISV